MSQISLMSALLTGVRPETYLWVFRGRQLRPLKPAQSGTHQVLFRVLGADPSQPLSAITHSDLIRVDNSTPGTYVYSGPGLDSSVAAEVLRDTLFSLTSGLRDQEGVVFSTAIRTIDSRRDSGFAKIG